MRRRPVARFSSPSRPAPATPGIAGRLGEARRVLAVVAHPDDESFGLGAVLATLHEAGAVTSVLCFTHGEASTLGRGSEGDLCAVRSRELAAAAATLGVTAVRLLDHPDGGLSDVPREELVRSVVSMAEDMDADLLLVFDVGGVTGHADHERATDAALAAAEICRLEVVAWTLPLDVASVLNAEFGTRFTGRTPSDIAIHLGVDRRLQSIAIGQHQSQATDNPVLWRRLDLLGGEEVLRVLRDR